MTRVKFQRLEHDHPITETANSLAAVAHDWAAKARASKMDFCAALANACGQILADAAKPQSGGKPLPREEAIRRMDDLRMVMEAAYDLRDVRGDA